MNKNSHCQDVSIRHGATGKKHTDFKTRVLRERIRRYFGRVPHSIHIITCQNQVIFDIEYTDFLSEFHVESALQRIIGSGFTLSVRRECSSWMMKEIMGTFTEKPDAKSLYRRMAEYEI